MPRSGGDAGKIGLRYEGIWTVAKLLDVATGAFTAIIPEPLGEQGRGIEFIAFRPDGVREFHSVKRQRSEGEWTLYELTRPDNRSGRSIFTDLRDKVVSTERDIAYFVSSTGATDACELCRRARVHSDAARFEEDVRESKPLADRFEKYVLPVTAGNWELAFSSWKRLHFAVIGEPELRDLVDQRISLIVYRPDGREFAGEELRVLLADFVFDHHGTELTAAVVWDFLKSHGFHRKDWAIDSTVLERLRDHNQRYLDSIARELINHTPIERQEAASIICQCTAADGPRRILVSAPAGVGKTCVLAQVTAAIVAANFPVLVIRIDQFGDVRSTRQMGAQIDLPLSPALVLTGVANGQDCVLVIDQLDAVSEASGRYPHLWDVFDALSREADRHPKMRMIVACRDFDLAHDHRLRKLTKEEFRYIHIPVPALSADDVRRAIQAAGFSEIHLSSDQIDLLQIPLHLYLFLEGTDPASGRADFSRVGDLFNRYWERKERMVARRLTHRPDWIPVIDAMCSAMSCDQRLYVSDAQLDEWSLTKKAMLTEHVLVEDDKRIRFFHESFFDYAFARRFSTSGKRLLDLLQGGEQHLFRRGQVRQVLAYLRDQDFDAYLGQLRDILTSDGVRFHIKRLVLAWIGTLSKPTPQEWEILVSLLDLSDLSRFVLPVARNSLAWFDLIYGLGVISEWLGSPDVQLVNRGMWFLDLPDVQKKRSAAAAEILAPHYGHNAEWNKRLRDYFHFGNAHHSRPIQELFLRLLRDGVLAVC